MDRLGAKGKNMNNEYATIYKDMMERYQSQSGIRNEVGVSGFRVGEKYNELSLMICGRAPNGTDCSYNKAVLSKKYDEIINIIDREIKEMDWMQYTNSPFLNIAKSIVIEHYGKKEENWYQYIMWTNLMKISPSSGGNPNNNDWFIQKDDCMKLFKLEIDTFKPKNIIMMTGFDWAFEFIESLGIDPNITLDTKYDRIAVGKYIYNNSNVIVLKRPESITRVKYMKALSHYLELT